MKPLILELDLEEFFQLIEPDLEEFFRSSSTYGQKAMRSDMNQGSQGKPVPSQTRILTRSLRLERNTNKSPQNGSPCSVSVTSIANESIPRRKSTGLALTNMRRPERTDIIAWSALPRIPPAKPSGRPVP